MQLFVCVFGCVRARVRVYVRVVLFTACMRAGARAHITHSHRHTHQTRCRHARGRCPRDERLRRRRIGEAAVQAPIDGGLDEGVGVLNRRRLRARDDEARLLRELVAAREGLVADVALEDHGLHDARAVADLEEVELRGGALVVEPAAQAHVFADVLGKVFDRDDRGDGGSDLTHGRGR